MTSYKIAILVGSLREGQHQQESRASRCALSPATGSTATSSRSATCRSTTRIMTRNPPPQYDRFRKKSPPPTECCSSARNIIAACPACSRTRSTSARGPMARASSTRSPRRSSPPRPASIGGFGSNHQIRQAAVFLNMPVMQHPEAYLGHVNDDSFDGRRLPQGRPAQGFDPRPVQRVRATGCT